MHYYFIAVGHNQIEPYSLSDKTSYRQISWSLEAARFDAKIIVTFWNMAALQKDVRLRNE